MKRIVSYSIFRDPGRAISTPAEYYADRLQILVRAHHLIWSGWDMYVHHDDAITNHAYWPAMRRMNDARLLRLVPCGQSMALCLSMLWRLKPAFEDNCEIVSCRDVDSIPLPNDRAAVEEFIATDKIVHTIHGAPPHGGLMGGTTSFKAPSMREAIECSTWQQMIDMGHAYEWRTYGNDQNFLTTVILSKMRDRALCHRFDGEGLKPPAETRMSITNQPTWEYPDAASGAGGCSEYVGHVYPPDPAKKFYMSLDVDPVFAKIRECE